jgi:hypothetical protein
MVTLKLFVPATNVAERMRECLRGSASAKVNKVVWQRPDGQRLLLYLDATFKVKLLDGWAVCQLNAQTDQTGQQTLQFVFFLGKANEGDGPQAACSINAASNGAAQIAAVWGHDLQRVLWDALLDVVEASVTHAGTAKPGQHLTLKGFSCGAEGFNTEVLAEYPNA